MAEGIALADGSGTVNDEYVVLAPGRGGTGLGAGRWVVRRQGSVPVSGLYRVPTRTHGLDDVEDGSTGRS
jgi:hypothetical protein